MRKFSLAIFSLILTLSMANTVLACGCGCKGDSCGNKQQIQGNNAQCKAKVQCPVTKEWFVANESTINTEYKGKTYQFCCGGCKSKFLGSPEEYIKDKAS